MMFITALLIAQLVSLSRFLLTVNVFTHVRINAVSNAQVRGESYSTGGCMGQTGMKNFVVSSLPGILLIIQVCFLIYNYCQN